MGMHFAQDPLIRLFLKSWAIGILLGLVCVAILMGLDTAGLRTLLMRSNFLWQGLALLGVGFGTFFGGIFCASAVMGINEKS